MKNKHGHRLSIFASALLLLTTSQSHAGETILVSVNSAGIQGNNISHAPSLSANGQFVAFASAATNLVKKDTNKAYDIFVHDRQSGQTTRVSVDSTGKQANGGSGGYGSSPPRMSADGRFVAFASYASNLVLGDTNRTWDVFVHDRQLGKTTLVSKSSAGKLGNSVSNYPSISADGRYVAFTSWASNLVTGDTNNYGDVFVHDRQSGTTALVSKSSAGEQGNLTSKYPAISGNGRFVAFVSDADNLVFEDNNAGIDAFVRDLKTGQTTRVSVDSAGGGESRSRIKDFPAISGDGRYVSFATAAPDFYGSLAWDCNSYPYTQIFVHDRTTGETSCVSVDSAGIAGTGDSYQPSISANGRYIAFASKNDHLVNEDTGRTDIFIHDQQTGQTARVSVDSAGTAGDGDSYLPTISADGAFVAFYSTASNLVVNDANNKRDVFVHQR